MNEFTPVTVRALAHHAGVSSATAFRYLRALNIPPCRVERLPNRTRRYYYDRPAVELLCQALSERLALAAGRRGLRRCVGGCDRYFPPGELRSRLCPACLARKTARNFAHHGDPARFDFDPHLAELLLQAAREILSHH